MIAQLLHKLSILINDSPVTTQIVYILINDSPVTTQIVDSHKW